MSTITPTIGRKVWLWAGDEGLSIRDPQQAVDATIIYVHEDGTINVRYTDHEGNQGVRKGVMLRDPGESEAHGDPGTEGFYCTWMPYQVGQAQGKAEAKPAAPAAKES